MPLTPDQERWAEALLIEKQHGPNAPRWVTDRITSLVAVGDIAGIERMGEIAVRLDQLLTRRRPS